MSKVLAMSFEHIPVTGSVSIPSASITVSGWLSILNLNLYSGAKMSCPELYYLVEYLPTLENS